MLVSHFANAGIALENVPWHDKQRDTLKEKSPTATFPYLETSSGVVSESNAINVWIADTYNKGLLGGSIF